MNRYYLVDGEERNRKYGESFEIPSRLARYNLKVGACVKVCFDDAERMWLEVTAIKGPGVYDGVLLNHPLGVDIKYGETVPFEACHVIGIGEPQRTGDAA